METLPKVCLKSLACELLIASWEYLNYLPLPDLVGSTELLCCVRFVKRGIWNRPCKAPWELGFSSRVKSAIFPGSGLCIPFGGHWTLDHSMVQSLCSRTIQAQVSHKFHWSHNVQPPSHFWKRTRAEIGDMNHKFCMLCEHALPIHGVGCRVLWAHSRE